MYKIISEKIKKGVEHGKFKKRTKAGMCSLCQRSRDQRHRSLQNDALVLWATYETEDKSYEQKENCVQDNSKKGNKKGNKKICKEINT
jgi:hypothetical protein